MSLTSIRVRALEKHTESLTLALQAVLRWGGCDVCYRNLNAALGLSWMTSVRDPDRCLATWMTEGRDAFLTTTAALFGVRLRELHAPEASLGLEDVPEFAQHFDASHKPLIELALENGQPVLAWRGWPGEAAAMWGVIASVCDEGIGLRGTTLGPGSESVVMTTPPVQAYVVEEIKPRVPPEDELLRLSVHHASIVLQNQIDKRFGITTGPEVYEAWRERLRQPLVCAVCGEGAPRCHRQLARAITTARESAIEFLLHHRDGAAGPARKTVDRITAECNGIVQALRRSCGITTVRGLLETNDGRAQLADDVKSARAHETRLEECVIELTGQQER